MSGSVRALWWSDDAAVSCALVVRAERNAALCGALHAAVAVEDGARETVGSTVLAVVRPVEVPNLLVLVSAIYCRFSTWYVV